MSKRKGGVADLRALLEARYGKDFLRVLENQRRPTGSEGADFMEHLEAPSSITEKSFSQRYGLIKQVHGKSPSYDSFRKTNMNSDAIKFAALLHQQEVINSLRARGDPLKELNRRGAEDLILCRMRYFTKRRKADEGAPAPGSAMAHRTRDLFVDPVGDVNSDTDDTPVYEEGSSSGDSNRSLFVDPEAVNERERGDFKVYVYREGKQELRLVVDCKTFGEPRDILQAAMHAFPEDSRAKKEELRPTYLMVWDATKWYYGILEIDGFVEVIAGELDESSLLFGGFPDADPKNPEEEFAANFTPSATRNDIRSSFAKWKLDMEYEKLYIPDGRHPVGKLFRIPTVYEFPRFLDDTNMNKGKRVFYEGLLKVLVGSDVASWDKNKIKKRWISRAVDRDQIKLADKFDLRESLSDLWSTMAQKIMDYPQVESDDEG